MPTIKSVVHLPTGGFTNKNGLFECGLFEPQRPVLSVVNGITTYDPDYDVIVVPSMPDPRTQKWNGSAVVAKTSGEIATYDAARLSTRSQATSRQKDVLATCALVVRARGITAWNNMTTQQKVTATLAEADVWKNIREFLDDKT